MVNWKKVRYLLVGTLAIIIAFLNSYAALALVFAAAVYLYVGRDSAGQKEFENELRLAIVTGIIFAFVVTQVSPAMIAVQKSLLVDKPVPEIEVNQPTTYERINKSHLRVPVFSVTISNDGSRPLSNLLLMIKNCEKAYQTNWRYDSPFQLPRSAVNHYMGDKCDHFVGISSMPQQRSVKLTIFDITSISEQEMEDGRGITDNDCIRYTDENWRDLTLVYSWEYKGREFTDKYLFSQFPIRDYETVNITSRDCDLRKPHPIFFPNATNAHADES